MTLFVALGTTGLLLLGGVGAVAIGLAHVLFGHKDHYKRLFYGAVAGGAIPMLLIAISITMIDGGFFIFYFPIVLIPLLGITMAIGVAKTKQKQVQTSVVQSLLYVLIGYPFAFLVLAFTHMSYTTIKQATISPYPNSQKVVFNIKNAWVPIFPHIQDYYSTTDSIEEVLRYYTDRSGLDCAKVRDRLEYDNGVGTIIGYDIQCQNYRVRVINQTPSSINTQTDTIANECKDGRVICTWIQLATYTNSNAISSAPWFYFDRRY